jgi:hypothetical protein
MVVTGAHPLGVKKTVVGRRRLDLHRASSASVLDDFFSEL